MAEINHLSKQCVVKQYRFWNFYNLKSFHTSNYLLKIIPSKTKTSSSHEWLTRQLNDIYVMKSRYDRYRCRSAYKLLEIDEKYKLFKPGLSIVECGAAPGSWTQVIAQKLKLQESLKDNAAKSGTVIAIDLQHIMPIKGATIIQESDFTDPLIQEQIFKLLPGGKTDIVLSDMAPKATGTTEIDSVAILKLVYSALGFSIKALRKDGAFLCKVWDCAEIETLYKHMQNLFGTVKRIKPKASRSDSSELFLLAREYKGIKNKTLKRNV